MTRCTISRMPIRIGDGYDWGGEYVLTFPVIDRYKAGPLEMTGEAMSLTFGSSQVDSLTASFLCEAINARLEQTFLNVTNYVGNKS